MNPVLSRRAHRDLAQLLGELVRGLVDFVGGGDGAYDFDQFHQRYRIEKVQADEALGALYRGQEFGHRDRGSVGGEDGIFLHDAVERGIHLLLFFHVLDDGFDDDVAVGEVRLVGRALKPGADRVFLLGRDAAFFRTGRSANFASDFSIPAKPLSRISDPLRER